MVDSYSHSLPISTKPLGVQGPTVLMALGTIQGLYTDVKYEQCLCNIQICEAWSFYEITTSTLIN